MGVRGSWIYLSEFLKTEIFTFSLWTMARVRRRNLRPVWAFVRLRPEVGPGDLTAWELPELDCG
jgi:hypothetical protein